MKNIKNTLIIGLCAVGFVPCTASVAEAWAIIAPTEVAETVMRMGWPDRCVSEMLGDKKTVEAFCLDTNGGSWQAIAICDGGRTGRTHRFGAWRQSGASNAYCQGTEKVVDTGISTSPDKL